MKMTIKKVLELIKEEGYILSVNGVYHHYDRGHNKFYWSHNSQSAYVSQKDMEENVKDLLGINPNDGYREHKLFNTNYKEIIVNNYQGIKFYQETTIL